MLSLMGTLMEMVLFFMESFPFTAQITSETAMISTAAAGAAKRHLFDEVFMQTTSEGFQLSSRLTQNRFLVQSSSLPTSPILMLVNAGAVRPLLAVR